MKRDFFPQTTVSYFVDIYKIVDIAKSTLDNFNLMKTLDTRSCNKFRLLHAALHKSGAHLYIQLFAVIIMNVVVTSLS